MEVEAEEDTTDGQSWALDAPGATIGALHSVANNGSTEYDDLGTLAGVMKKFTSKDVDFFAMSRSKTNLRSGRNDTALNLKLRRIFNILKGLDLPTGLWSLDHMARFKDFNDEDTIASFHTNLISGAWDLDLGEVEKLDRCRKVGHIIDVMNVGMIVKSDGDFIPGAVDSNVLAACTTTNIADMGLDLLVGETSGAVSIINSMGRTVLDAFTGNLSMVNLHLAGAWTGKVGFDVTNAVSWIVGGLKEGDGVFEKINPENRMRQFKSCARLEGLQVKREYLHMLFGQGSGIFSNGEHEVEFKALHVLMLKNQNLQPYPAYFSKFDEFPHTRFDTFVDMFGESPNWLLGSAIMGMTMEVALNFLLAKKLADASQPVKNLMAKSAIILEASDEQSRYVVPMLTKIHEFTIAQKLMTEVLGHSITARFNLTHVFNFERLISVLKLGMTLRVALDKKTGKETNDSRDRLLNINFVDQLTDMPSMFKEVVGKGDSLFSYFEEYKQHISTWADPEAFIDALCSDPDSPVYLFNEVIAFGSYVSDLTPDEQKKTITTVADLASHSMKAICGVEVFDPSRFNSDDVFRIGRKLVESLGEGTQLDSIFGNNDALVKVHSHPEVEVRDGKMVLSLSLLDCVMLANTTAVNFPATTTTFVKIMDMMRTSNTHEVRVLSISTLPAKHRRLTRLCLYHLYA